jgi:hypothetical protein
VVFDFERLHQAARDARAKGKNRVMLPHAEFLGAREVVFRELKGNRTRQLPKVDLHRFTAWGVQFVRALEPVTR